MTAKPRIDSKLRRPVAYDQPAHQVWSVRGRTAADTQGKASRSVGTRETYFANQGRMLIKYISPTLFFPFDSKLETAVAQSYVRRDVQSCHSFHKGQ
jgi:hypothetical protein